MTHDKKQVRTESPNVGTLQPVVIDKNTTIYIAPEADPEEARLRYINRHLRIRT